jgi:hypothetical protein
VPRIIGASGRALKTLDLGFSSARYGSNFRHNVKIQKKHGLLEGRT